MRITQWGEYGVHCAIFIASREQSKAVPVVALEIADAQGIPLQYAQQILQRLRKGNIIESVRGPHGGYRLARAADGITLKDILVAAEGNTLELICETKPISEERCGQGSCCELRDVWHALREHVDSFLVSKSLAELSAASTAKSKPVQIARVKDYA